MTIMSSVNEEQSGMASGTYTTVRQFALTAGVAILSAIITAFKSGYSSKFNTAMTYTLSVRNAMIAALVLSAIAIACSLLLIKRS